jgi:hypothetical protein
MSSSSSRDPSESDTRYVAASHPVPIRAPRRKKPIKWAGHLTTWRKAAAVNLFEFHSHPGLHPYQHYNSLQCQKMLLIEEQSQILAGLSACYNWTTSSAKPVHNPPSGPNSVDPLHNTLSNQNTIGTYTVPGHLSSLEWAWEQGYCCAQEPLQPCLYTTPRR